LMRPPNAVKLGRTFTDIGICLDILFGF
jgi:hypothetical protein